MSASRPDTSSSAWTFFLLVFALSVPFWVLGAVSTQPLTSTLSLGSLMAVSPIVAALVLTTSSDGLVGVRNLLGRAFDFGRIRARAWYLVIFLLLPTTMVVEYAILQLTGATVPGPRFDIPELPLTFAFFFIAAILEEVGWSGYAIDRLQHRRSALGAALLLGTVWGAWHLPAILEMPAAHSPDWIAWQVGNQIVIRILIVWIYNNTGRSVFGAILFHAMLNLSTLVLFPVYGSYYDPFVADALLAVVAAVVVFVWGPRTLARRPRRHAQPTTRDGSIWMRDSSRI